MAFDPALVFLSGGMALADIKNKYTVFTANNPGFSSSGVDAGWTLGAGAEFALTNNIGMSAQYLRLEMPQSTHSFTNIGAQYKFVLDDSANILRVGLNWHFD
jgi:outer membrane immunogenic protein